MAMNHHTLNLKKKMQALTSNYYEIGIEANIDGKDVHDYLCGVIPLDDKTAVRLEKALELLYWRTMHKIEKAFSKTI